VQQLDAEPPPRVESSHVESAGETRIAVRGGVVDSPLVALLSRPALAVATLLLLALLVEHVPLFRSLRLLSGPAPSAMSASPMQPASVEVGESELKQESGASAALEQPDEVSLPRAARGPIAGGAEAPFVDLDPKQPPVPLEDASGHGLDGFYRALDATVGKRPGAITRIAYLGDSIVVSDLVTGTLRRKLHKQFGDAGHGFVLIANPWPGYFHNDVYRWASGGWRVSRIVGPMAQDGLYGLGGVSFKASAGARARVGTNKKGKFGHGVSKFVVAYLEQPNGGQLSLSVDGEPRAVVDTNGPSKRSAWYEVRVPDGEHELEILTAGREVRLFGVILERDGPGVVLDAIGVQGARIRFLDQQDDAHWAEQLRGRKPDVLIYQFGANESGDGFAYPMDEYNKTMTAVLRQGRDAVPEAGCLVIGAMDRAQKRGDALVTMEVIPAIVKEQRAAAAAVGCAFFDTYQAMGGLGSMASWARRGLGQADFTHPSGLGAEIIAAWLHRALIGGYKDWSSRQARSTH
jgi:lysophospholipase L1-like esterase